MGKARMRLCSAFFRPGVSLDAEEEAGVLERVSSVVNLPRDKPGGFSPFETAPQKRSLTISR